MVATSGYSGEAFTWQYSKIKLSMEEHRGNTKKQQSLTHS